MQRIERIERRDGVEPIRLTLLSPVERELDREERERKRRERPGPKPASGGTPSSRPEADAPRLDLRA